MNIPNSKRLKIYFWGLLVINIGYITWMKSFLAPLETNEILRFEIARTTSRATDMVAAWKSAPPKFDMVALSLPIDYLFIVLYSTGLIVAVLFIARLSAQDLLVRCSKFIAVLLVAAAVCDVVENIFLARMLSNPANEFAVRMAYNFAAAKFSVIILTLLFLSICLIFFLMRMFTSKQSLLMRQ